MRLFNLAIIIAVAFICLAFFMPWVAGKGSLAGPIDAITSIFENEPTGLVEVFSGAASGSIDFITQAISPIELDRQLAGHQLPVAAETEDLRPQIYLLYLLPVVALVCAFLGISGNKLKVFAAFVVAAAIFILMAGQISVLNTEGVFVKIQTREGFWYTLFAFAGLSLSLFLKLFSRLRLHKNTR